MFEGVEKFSSYAPLPPLPSDHTQGPPIIPGSPISHNTNQPRPSSAHHAPSYFTDHKGATLPCIILQNSSSSLLYGHNEELCVNWTVMIFLPHTEPGVFKIVKIIGRCRVTH